MVDVDVHVSSHLKEELAWAADKQLRVISTINKNTQGAKKGEANQKQQLSSR